MRNEEFSKIILTKSTQNTSTGRSSHSQIFFKISALKHFAIFTGKYLCKTLFLINLQTFSPATSFTRDSNRAVFCKYCKIFKSSFFDRWPLVATSEAELLNSCSGNLYFNECLWISKLYTVGEVYPNMVIHEQCIFIINDPAGKKINNFQQKLFNQNSFHHLDLNSLLLQDHPPAQVQGQIYFWSQ